MKIIKSDRNSSKGGWEALDPPGQNDGGGRMHPPSPRRWRPWYHSIWYLLLCNRNCVFKYHSIMFGSLHFPLAPFFRYSTSKNIVTLKSRSEVTQGHWKWYNSIDWFGFLLVFHGNFVSKCTVFAYEIRLQKCRDLEMTLSDLWHRFINYKHETYMR